MRLAAHAAHAARAAHAAHAPDASDLSVDQQRVKRSRGKAYFLTGAQAKLPGVASNTAPSSIN